MLLSSQSQAFAIKNNGTILSTHTTLNEAEIKLISLKSNDSSYNNATITVVNENNQELLLG
jgi:hypothetical protein